MNVWRVWREAATTQTLLRSWRRAGVLDADGLRRANAMLSGDPSPAAWRWFLDRLGLWLGVALCAAGVICFIAANWERLGKFARLYGFQGLLFIAIAVTAKIGLARVGGQAALWLATMILGGLLALIGQTYQTGADTWELFALWTALALPWALAARNAVQWLTWVGLLNIAFGLWLGLYPDFWWFGDRNVSLWLGLLNLMLLLGWETAGRRWPEFGGRAGRWLLAVAALAPLSFAAMDERLSYSDSGPIKTLLWAAATAALVIWYWRMRRDLPVLAMCALSIVAVLTTVLIDVLLKGHETAGGYLFIAIAVIGQAAVAALLLRRLTREEAR